MLSKNNQVVPILQCTSCSTPRDTRVDDFFSRETRARQIESFCTPCIARDEERYQFSEEWVITARARVGENA